MNAHTCTPTAARRAQACRNAIRPTLLVALAMLAGCESMEKADRYLDRQWAAPSAMLPPESITTTVRRDDVSATVTFAPRASALSVYERDQLIRFVARSGASNGDRAVIALSTAAGRALAERRVRLLANDLHRQGISVTRSFGPGDPNAATVTITRTVAVLPDCPQWQDLIKRNQIDEYHVKLGCLNASSLAATVHRPLDLVSGRPSGPSDGTVVANGIQSLREGKFDTSLTSSGTGSPQSGQSGQQGSQPK